MSAPALNPATPEGLSVLPPPHAGARYGLPATGLLLVGTWASCRGVAVQLEALAPGVVTAGCLLIGAQPEARQTRELAVLGSVDDLLALHARYGFRAALVSVPRSGGPGTTSGSAALARVRALLKQAGIPWREVGALEDALNAPAGGAQAAGVKVDPAALIGRTHWGVDRRQVSAIIKGKRVLITGAGGSIGGELARVCASFGPASVIMMERAENALFEIDQQMGRRFPGVARHAVLHDVCDEPSTARALAQLRPHVVFHAAAHKHVPLMEDHPSHALSNNLFGTRSIVDASVRAGVERFVMISSDKAVNPTSVMGATKRLAEMYIGALAPRAQGTRLSMVRFGNVLASACSVIPIWSQQLGEGHPLTVTDPRMTRYFMTIPEAATLVVQAGALDQPTGHAPVYVLDMGEPISILEMAVRFLRQHGLAPAIDAHRLPAAVEQAPLAERCAVENRLASLSESDDGLPTHPIVFSGARPGEKLFEELAYSAEMLTPTAHPAIGQWRASGAAPIDAGAMIKQLGALREPHTDKAAVVGAIRAWVPEMRRAEA